MVMSNDSRSTSRNRDTRIVHGARALGAVFVLAIVSLIATSAARAEPFAYVTNVISDNVSVIDIASNIVIATVTVGSFPVDVAITPDGAFAYVTNRGFGNVSVIDTVSNTVTATVPVGLDVRDIAITPDGAFAYVTNFPSDVSVIDIVSNAVTATVAVGSTPEAIAITPDGAFAYVQMPALIASR
jgi:YVTN family beta-propeller protein